MSHSMRLLRPAILCRNKAMIIACIALCALSGVYLSLSLSSRQNDATNSRCRGRLAQLYLALRNYHDEFGTFPPYYVKDGIGQRHHSWRALILRYLQPDVFAQYNFDETWNSQHNAALVRENPNDVVSLFKSPSDHSSSPMTDFLAVIPASVTNGSGAIIGEGERGQSSKIVIVELRHSGILWNEPRDLSSGQSIAALAEAVERYGSICVLTADGHVGTLTTSSLIFNNSTDELLRRWVR